jgi:UDP-N-acetylmuramyl pentapeptide phosphotransferase/UDP-N-acetylglucosamine-1-phosphate transferase
MTVAVIAGLVAFATSASLTPLFRARARRLNRLDIPNERSSHTMPTPRDGGSAIVLGAALGAGLFGFHFDTQLLVLALGAATVALLALADERRGLTQSLRFLVQLVAASGAVLGLLRLNPSLVVKPPWSVSVSVLALVSVLWVAWVVNAYNFMDGINGIAGSEAIVCGLTLGVLFGRTDDVGSQILAFGLAGAAAGFLPWNLPSGSIFMGDVGAYALGFLFSTLALRAGAEGMLVPAMLPLLPFLADATVTLGRRILRGEKFFRAHRSHYYQRLTILGWSHARVTALWTMLAVVSGAVALGYTYLGTKGRVAMVAGLLALHGAVALSITAAERRRDAAPAA